MRKILLSSAMVPLRQRVNDVVSDRAARQSINGDSVTAARTVNPVSLLGDVLSW
jgi:hypothetical protein